MRLPSHDIFLQCVDQFKYFFFDDTDGLLYSITCAPYVVNELIDGTLPLKDLTDVNLNFGKLVL